MSELSISIPTDNDGYVLLQCSLCREYFKLLASTVNSDEVINIWCPYCGLNGRHYAPEEVIDNAMKMATNEAYEMIDQLFKNFEKKTKNNKYVTFKSGKSHKKEIISPIKVRTDNLEKKQYKCCGAVAKIRPLSKECGSYCPICGGINYE